MKNKKLLIAVTVPETLTSILKGQPAFLSGHYEVFLVSSGSDSVHTSETQGCTSFAVSMVRGISPHKDLISILAMIKLLIKIRPLIVHSYTPKAGLVTMLAAWVCRIPIRVHTFTGLIFPTSRGAKKSILMLVDRLICACATHVVPEGEGVKKDLLQNNITKKRLSVIGFGNIAGVDTKYFSRLGRLKGAQFRVGLNIPAERFLFCFVGRLNKDKGLDELVTAFANLQGDSHLLLVGSVDESAPISRKTLEKINAHPRIHFSGYLEDVRPALNASDILVLPSYREGFPNVVLQAGAMELPSIVTDVNGSNEVITHGFNGWVVPPRNTQALNSAMKAAMDTPAEELIKLGKNARNRIQKKFEQKDHWIRMLSFYQKISDDASTKN